ncbi:MAG TPA: hypothetical protein PKA42_03750 [Candidatus Paceibacterota bacterium]|nr:hypothetical protein [Candidatus Paceibacterota bacterium]HMO83253.1 hypothetical protein [Candidatus Paceibacterota bacterium]
MRKAIGFILVLWGLSQFMEKSFHALDDAASASLNAIETAAVVAQERLNHK